MEAQQTNELKQGLSNRHIQLIALGGAVGTGLFLGISQTIKLAGLGRAIGFTGLCNRRHHCISDYATLG